MDSKEYYPYQNLSMRQLPTTAQMYQLEDMDD